jgi:hypothetical protein
MPRPKKYEDAAARQREYRRRKFIESLTPEVRRIESNQRQHACLKRWAEVGDPVAAQIVGPDFLQTALNYFAYMDDQALHWARQEAARRLGDDKSPDVKSK